MIDVPTKANPTISRIATTIKIATAGGVCAVNLMKNDLYVIGADIEFSNSEKRELCRFGCVSVLLGGRAMHLRRQDESGFVEDLFKIFEHFHGIGRRRLGLTDIEAR